MMKKVICAVLCLSVLLCTGTVVASASSCDAIGTTLQNGWETFVSICARQWNLLWSVNEGKTEQASARTPSWTPSRDLSFDGAPDFSVQARTWVCTEIALVSKKTYANPYTDVDVDLKLVGNGRAYTIPGFWDGNNTWKIRFVCPSVGEWKFVTQCSDSSNGNLHNRTGVVQCLAYEGVLDIYRHGFVTTAKGHKYFTYDDGEPFFYLGDTHWSLGDETLDMVQTISKTRYAQGFTVIQSEPIGATFDLTNGVTEADLEGFSVYDRKFQMIVQAGLVHANAEFFFPSYMPILIRNNGGWGEQAKQALDRLSRYWVARYGAYPVLWTLGQEVDRDFYEGIEGGDAHPYKYVADCIEKYDAYDHPLSAHQEYSGRTSCLGSAGRYHKSAEPSAFRNVSAHDWYAVQWNPSKTGQSNFEVEKDYWYGSEGKPSILYEGQYSGLWTKTFGARMQGWNAFLNGMYGYGWGGQDTWSYLNIYDEANDSTDGVDVITAKEKQDATWQDALRDPSAAQSAYMRTFMQSLQWEKLIPRFDNRAYFVRSPKVYATVASNENNSELVIYFYSFTDAKTAASCNTSGRGGAQTGTIGNLQPGQTYYYRWFHPQAGSFSEEFSFTATRFGTYSIGERKWNGETVDCDMTLYVYTK